MVAAYQDTPAAAKGIDTTGQQPQGYHVPPNREPQPEAPPQFAAQHIISAEQALQAQQQGLTAEQTDYIININERYARTPDDLHSILALSLALTNVEHRTKAEVFPAEPGKFTVWFLVEKAQDPILIGAIQNSIDRKLPAKLAEYLVTWLEKALHSWNSTDVLNRETIASMDVELAQMVYQALMREMNRGEALSSASISRS